MKPTPTSIPGDLVPITPCLVPITPRLEPQAPHTQWIKVRKSCQPSLKHRKSFQIWQRGQVTSVRAPDHQGCGIPVPASPERARHPGAQTGTLALPQVTATKSLPDLSVVPLTSRSSPGLSLGLGRECSGSCFLHSVLRQ